MILVFVWSNDIAVAYEVNLSCQRGIHGTRAVAGRTQRPPDTGERHQGLSAHPPGQDQLLTPPAVAPQGHPSWAGMLGASLPRRGAHSGWAVCCWNVYFHSFFSSWVLSRSTLPVVTPVCSGHCGAFRRVQKLLRTRCPKPGSQFSPESGGAGGGGGLTASALPATPCPPPPSG